MKSNKAAGPSKIVSEMLKASCEAGSDVVTDLVNSIVSEGIVPTYWEKSSIINCYKGKGDAMDRSNYRGLKMLGKVMKVLGRIIERLIREKVNTDGIKFGFMKWHGTIDAIFIARQLQEKYLQTNRKFIYLEKAFGRFPRHVIWWEVRKLDIDEWIVSVVTFMYGNVRSHVKITGCFSEEF